MCLAPAWPPGGTCCGGGEDETNPQSRIPALDPDAALLRVPHYSCGGGGAYGAARVKPEIIGPVRHSPMRKAPSQRGSLVSQAWAAEVRGGASTRHFGDRC